MDESRHGRKRKAANQLPLPWRMAGEDEGINEKQRKETAARVFFGGLVIAAILLLTTVWAMSLYMGTIFYSNLCVCVCVCM